MHVNFIIVFLHQTSVTSSAQVEFFYKILHQSVHSIVISNTQVNCNVTACIRLLSVATRSSVTGHFLTSFWIRLLIELWWAIRMSTSLQLLTSDCSLLWQAEVTFIKEFCFRLFCISVYGSVKSNTCQLVLNFCIRLYSFRTRSVCNRRRRWQEMHRSA